MQQGATRVFVDANILFSRTLRDWFVLISMESGPDGIKLLFSEDVLAEFVYHLRKKHPELSDTQVGGWRRRIIESCPGSLVTGYEIDPRFLAGDPFDAHVIAACGQGVADYLVTSNVKDFLPFEDSLEFEIFSPDDYLTLVLQRRPGTVLSVIKDQMKYWASRPGSRTLPEALTRAGAPLFATEVQKILKKMALGGNY